MVEGTKGTAEGTKEGVEGRKKVVEDAKIDTESREVVEEEEEEREQDLPMIESVPAITSIYENQHLEILQDRLRRYGVEPKEQYVIIMIISIKHSPNAERAFKEFFTALRCAKVRHVQL